MGNNAKICTDLQTLYSFLRIFVDCLTCVAYVWYISTRVVLRIGVAPPTHIFQYGTVLVTWDLSRTRNHHDTTIQDNSLADLFLASRPTSSSFGGTWPDLADGEEDDFADDPDPLPEVWKQGTI